MRAKDRRFFSSQLKDIREIGLDVSIDEGGMLRIGEHEVHVWYAFPEKCFSPLLQKYYLSLLSNKELERYLRFARDELKAEYLLTRALCRTVLSKYSDLLPESWEFEVGHYGKPRLSGKYAESKLSFNMSNSPGLVAMVVARSNDGIGIDVEFVGRSLPIMSIAEATFSSFELADLKLKRGAALKDRFFDVWVLKEAYVKALGLGLSMPTKEFSVVFDGDRVGISFNELMLHCQQCQFWLHPVDERHRLGVCVLVPGGRAVEMRIGETIPGEGERL